MIGKLRSQQANDYMIPALYPLVILVCLIYLPGVWLGPGWPAMHFEDVLILAGGLYGVASHRLTVTRFLGDSRTKWFAVPYLAILLWLAAITLFESIFEPDSVVVRSALFRMASMFRGPCFVITILACVRSGRGVGLLVAGLLGIGLVQVPILYCQKNNLFGINDWLTPRYSMIFESSIYSLSGFRADGTFGNPNHAAVAMVPIAALGYGYFLMSGGALWRRLVSLFVALGLLGAVIMLNQSRAGAAGIVGALAVIHLMGLYLRRRSAFILPIAFIALSILILPYLFSDNSDVAQRFSAFHSKQEFLEDESMSARQEMWKDGLADLGGDIVTGRGLGGLNKKGFFDSGYVEYTYSGGLVAALLFVVWCTGSALKARRLCLHDVGVRHSPYLLGTTCGLFACMLVTAISHPVLFNDRIWLLHLTIIVLALLSAEKTVSVNGKLAPQGRSPLRKQKRGGALTLRRA